MHIHTYINIQGVTSTLYSEDELTSTDIHIHTHTHIRIHNEINCVNFRFRTV